MFNGFMMTPPVHRVYSVTQLIGTAASRTVYIEDFGKAIHLAQLLNVEVHEGPRVVYRPATVK